MWSNPVGHEAPNPEGLYMFIPSLKLRVVLSLGLPHWSSLVNGRFRNQLGWLEFLSNKWEER
jgi:hypothetical protein